jgi:hypothetical protein
MEGGIMKAKKAKIQVVIVAEFPVDLPIDQEAWPKCKTIAAVAKFEQHLWNKGHSDINSFIDNSTIKSVKFSKAKGSL